MPGYEPGAILRIPLRDGLHTYGQMAREPVVIFFEGAFEKKMPPWAVAGLPVAFRVIVFRSAIYDAGWQQTGYSTLGTDNSRDFRFYKQDPVTGALTLCTPGVDIADNGRPATLAECEGLECLAAWEPLHVVERLEDRLANRPNRWVENLKIDRTILPPACR